WLRGALGEAAISAARTDTFLGARYRRIVKRRGHMKALVAVARSILVSVWHLMANPTARYRDLGPDFHTRNLDPGRKTRDLIRQLTALGRPTRTAPWWSTGARARSTPQRHPRPGSRLTALRLSTASQPRHQGLLRHAHLTVEFSGQARCCNQPNQREAPSAPYPPQP
ncbi:hypothetical protein OV450_8538, partial [Actinobacteria bacterium OV450]